MNLKQSLFLNQPKISLLEYLEFEEASDIKHEYHDGKVRPLSNKTIKHSKIGGNLGAAIGNELVKHQKDCSAFANLKITNVDISSIVYPDLIIACGEEIFPIANREDVISNPIVLFEIISLETGTYDYGGKFNIYQTFDTFKQYVLVEQEFPYVEVRTLENAARSSWTFRTYTDMNDVFELKSIGISFALKDIYRRVKFE